MLRRRRFPNFPSLGWAKTIFDLGVKQMFYGVTLQQDLIFLIDSWECKFGVSFLHLIIYRYS